jgi:hypothetical protein
VALTVPDSEDFLVHMRRTEAFSTTEEDWVDDSLQRATDLASIATGLTEDPTDDLQLRMLTTGIFAMAHSIFVTSGEDREALYSPFSSERLGSYSYSKSQQAVLAGSATGVPEFDSMVRYFASIPGIDDNDRVPAFRSTSEKVWTGPYGSTSDDTFGTPDPSRQITLVPDAWNE